MLPSFQPLDRRIRHFELLLERSLESLPVYELPAGYTYTTYQDGDRDEWIRIESSAGEFNSYEEGLAAWQRYYGGREETLESRMFFIENMDGRKIATATAYHDITGRDTSGAAWLHWVSVEKGAQGQGLSKPLICRVLARMAELGYTNVKVPTQTDTWLACKVYLDLGFTPIPLNAFHNRDGWRIIRRLTDHPLLWMMDPAPDDLVLQDGVPDPGHVAENNLERKSAGRPC